MQPLLSTVAASITYGGSLCYVRLQASLSAIVRGPTLGAEEKKAIGNEKRFGGLYRMIQHPLTTLPNV